MRDDGNVKYYLIEYDRVAGKVVRKECFDDVASAMSERFRRERELEPGTLEIVVLGAKSEEELVSTHASYFKSAAELAPRLPA